VPETVLLRPGDSLVMFTDGVTERRAGKEFYGPERVSRTAAQLAAHPAASLTDWFRRFWTFRMTFRKTTSPWSHCAMIHGHWPTPSRRDILASRT
jgi:hypothetical protein